MDSVSETAATHVHRPVRRSVIQEHNGNVRPTQLSDQEGEQIMGALALIQLAKNATDELATPLNLSKCRRVDD